MKKPAVYGSTEWAKEVEREQRAERIRDRLVVIAWVVGIAAAFATFVTVPPYLIGRFECSTYAEQTGRTVRYAAWTCYVQQPSGRFIPYDEMRARATTNEEIRP